MDLADAERLARSLMRAHGLTDWSFGWDSAVRRAGVTRFADRRITLSRKLTALHDEPMVRDTVLHEIAHALVGPGHGHDAVWRRRAVAIGASGERCIDGDAPAVEGRWVGTCRAGHRITRHRRPSRVGSCRRCGRGFDLRNVYTWTLDGEPAPMLPAYEAELARLRRGSGAAREGEPRRRSVAAAIPPGTPVRVTATGRYQGRRGVVEARRRTRYLVDLGDVRVTVPFHLVEAVRSASGRS